MKNRCGKKRAETQSVRRAQGGQDRMEMFRLRCIQNGLKITPQRLAVYEALTATGSHPSAEQLYTQLKQKMPGLSLDTVNRTLMTLTKIGAAFAVEGSGQPRRYDAGPENHQHFRCVKCDKIFDFSHPGFDNIKPPPQLGKSFKIIRKTVYFEGICDKCS